MNENSISLNLPDDEWEEYRPQEINLDTLTIWLAHKNRYPPMLALTPDDPNFSSDPSHPQTAKYDYMADLEITQFPNEQIAKQYLGNCYDTSEKIGAPFIPVSLTPLLAVAEKTKGEFLGENAIFLTIQNKKICHAVQINDFVLTGNIFNYTALPAASTPIHSAICELSRKNHLPKCKCQYCKSHPPCSTIKKRRTNISGKSLFITGIHITWYQEATATQKPNTDSKIPYR